MEKHLASCTQCGANLPSSVINGTVRCEYCDTVYNVYKIEEDDILTEDENGISDIILKLCVDYAAKHCMSLIFGSSLESSDNKFYPKAVIRFHIPSNENIFYIQDCSILGGCRKGFALGKNGIYYRTEQKIIGFMQWNEFKDSSLSMSMGMLYINDLEFNSGATGEAGLILMEQIQESIRLLL
ncbi:hypothetical protein [Anaeromicropila herbilytica]|uniref:Uncharacterized protein n=1 Tax=Anaeromicropila herbilytica TaxID=2785025 RepID=A0A7R7ICU9_9FIRM|nr:hypothetical protein [Anaeromicropila herbilytica]BCN29363.1 hypothetical protein bsdtb5_06580 [Anaeromicropila herbilytica]